MENNIKITVEKFRVEGRGAIWLTGPSGCGKGEIAKALCKFLSIPEERHLSMGGIHRETVNRVSKDKTFRLILEQKYNISTHISIFDGKKNKPEITKKAKNYYDDIVLTLDISNEFVSQFDWLKFCVINGLLIPDDWTINIINALLENSPELYESIFILDGYPRTVTAAESILETFSKLNIPIIKVLHLFITKEQMNIRVSNRGRIDDTKNSLDRRYQFYVGKVQPCIDYLKSRLGSNIVLLIDAHKPVYYQNMQLNVQASINEVVLTVMQELGLPRLLMDFE